MQLGVGRGEGALSLHGDVALRHAPKTTERGLRRGTRVEAARAVVRRASRSEAGEPDEDDEAGEETSWGLLGDHEGTSRVDLDSVESKAASREFKAGDGRFVN
jgi:hypothetical protein